LPKRAGCAFGIAAQFLDHRLNEKREDVVRIDSQDRVNICQGSVRLIGERVQYRAYLVSRYAVWLRCQHVCLGIDGRPKNTAGAIPQQEHLTVCGHVVTGQQRRLQSPDMGLVVEWIDLQCARIRSLCVRKSARVKLCLRLGKIVQIRLARLRLRLGVFCSCPSAHDDHQQIGRAHV